MKKRHRIYAHTILNWIGVVLQNVSAGIGDGGDGSGRRRCGQERPALQGQRRAALKGARCA